MNCLLSNNIHSFIQQYLVGTYYVPITVSGIWDRPVNKDPCPKEAYIVAEKDRQQK